MTTLAPVPAGPAARTGEGPKQRGVKVPRPSNTALTQLGVDAAALRRVQAQRPWLVAQALLTGATPQQVVAVLEWELDELRFAVGRWVPNLRKQGQLSEGQGAVLLARVHGSQ
jgi:hypothetical protein